MGSSPKKATLIYDNSYLFEKKQSKIFNFDTDSNNRGEESSSNLPQITSPRPSGVHQLSLDKKHRFKNPRKFCSLLIRVFSCISLKSFIHLFSCSFLL